jgi:hypothetical protein
MIIHSILKDDLAALWFFTLTKSDVASENLEKLIPIIVALK